MIRMPIGSGLHALIGLPAIVGTVPAMRRNRCPRSLGLRIQDQVRLCEERAARENWRVVKRYTDHAISGTSLVRRGIQALMQDAQSGKFDVVLTK